MNFVWSWMWAKLGSLQALSFVHVGDFNDITHPDSTPKWLEIKSVSGWLLQRLLDNLRKLLQMRNVCFSLWIWIDLYHRLSLLALSPVSSLLNNKGGKRWRAREWGWIWMMPSNLKKVEIFWVRFMHASVTERSFVHKESFDSSTDFQKIFIIHVYFVGESL